MENAILFLVAMLIGLFAIGLVLSLWTADQLVLRKPTPGQRFACVFGLGAGVLLMLWSGSFFLAR